MLQQKITDILRILPQKQKVLKKLGIETVQDMLSYFPVRYSNVSIFTRDEEFESGDTICVAGTVKSVESRRSWRTKVPMANAVIMNTAGKKISLTWFRQAFVGKVLREGDNIIVTGRATRSGRQILMTNPEFEKVKVLPIDLGESLFTGGKVGGDQFGHPIYRATAGITSRWIYHAMRKTLAKLKKSDITDPIPESILKKYKLPPLYESLFYIHTPKKKAHSESARKRFAFEEIFLLQVNNVIRNLCEKASESYRIKTSLKDLEKYFDALGIVPTNAQRRVLREIKKDIASGSPMARLLHGDVGSGKTLVAFGACNMVLQQNNKVPASEQLQIAYMAPVSYTHLTLPTNREV